MVTFMKYEGGKLTDLLYSEVGVLCFQLLMHTVSKENPAVHGSRCFLDAGRRGARMCGRFLGCLRLGACGWLKVKSGFLILGYRNNSLTAVATVRKRKSNGLSHLLDQTVLEVLHEHVAEELLYVAL